MARERYSGPETRLSHHVVGVVDEAQVGELFAAGWRWNPNDQHWHKVFIAEDGSPEQPPFLEPLL